MERADLGYLLLGVAASAEHRSRAVLSAGTRTVELAGRPAAVVWRSPIAAPLRNRAVGVGSSLERDGRELAARIKTRSMRAADTVGAYADQLLAAGIADNVVSRLLDTGALDRMITVAINHPATDTLLVNTLGEPALDRLIGRVIESRLVDDVTARLLDSNEMQRVIDRVARSPELRGAIGAALSHQTAGMATDVADGMRSRTVVGDVAVERFARSLVRRKRPPKDE